MLKPNIHHSRELENAVLGACILEPNATSICYSFLKPELFYFPGNPTVCEALVEMFRTGEVIDLLTLSDLLIRRKKIEFINNQPTAYYLARMTNSVCGSAHIIRHCQILADMWRDRELMRITSEGLRNGLSGSEAAFDLIQRVQSLQEGQTEDEFSDMSALMLQVYKHMDTVSKTGGVGIPTGFSIIDRKQGGLHGGDMIVLGARPGVGKSALMGQWALSMAHAGYKVGIISLEMSNVQIASRLAAIDTQTDFNIFYKGLEIDERQAELLHNRINSTTSNLPIYVSDKTGLNIVDIKAKASRFKRENGLDILMIDYLQLLDPISQKSNRNREQEVSEMSRGCKLLAKQLQIPVIVLAQLNREVTNRRGNDRYPKLSDLRESGSLEQDADAVMFLHKDFLSGVEAGSEGNSTENEADLLIAKWRNQEANFRIPLEWIGTRMQFKERTATSSYKTAAPKPSASTNYTDSGKSYQSF